MRQGEQPHQWQDMCCSRTRAFIHVMVVMTRAFMMTIVMVINDHHHHHLPLTGSDFENAPTSQDSRGVTRDRVKHIAPRTPQNGPTKSTPRVTTLRRADIQDVTRSDLRAPSRTDHRESWAGTVAGLAAGSWICGVISVVQATWCKPCGASYVVQSMWSNLCGVS